MKNQESKTTTLLDLLRVTHHNQTINLFNANCTIITTGLTRQGIIADLITNHTKHFRAIINCEIEFVYVTDGNLEISLKESFD